MGKIVKRKVVDGIYYIEIEKANLKIQCGSPADSVKHLTKKDIIKEISDGTAKYEIGPNAILFSDVMIQNGSFSNLSEFSVLQMFYKQGLIIPGHPNNTGVKPMLIGSLEQVRSQLQYIYRGNYGLVSKEEIKECGIDDELADELMRMKLKFAFGKIQTSDSLFDISVVNGGKNEIRDGVYIARKSSNVFEISFEDESVKVDLNLPKDEVYSSPYILPSYHLEREYFSIIHSGQGDGWDVMKPSMSSIITFQGRVYLVDVGPNIEAILDSLGISISEIDGLFHTHSHDDHFAGITALIKSDKRVKYYASSLVRSATAKKLSALLSIEESDFEDFFDVQELEIDNWNNIDGLEVKPIISPHPVETTIYVFRTMWNGEYKTYGHFADIVSLKLLEGMVGKKEEGGISEKFFNKVKEAYLQKLDLKKIDIGGGMIHGEAEDFAEDLSQKLILAHTSIPFTNRQREIGSTAPFGMRDVLIKTNQDYMVKIAYDHLIINFPTLKDYQRKILLNNPVVTFNPETIILKEGSEVDFVYLVITGSVELISTKKGSFSMLTAGVTLGEKTALTGVPPTVTSRAKSFVKALKIPKEFFLQFIRGYNLDEEMKTMAIKRLLIQENLLFNEDISYSGQNKIIKDIGECVFEEGDIIPQNSDEVYLIIQGQVRRSFQNDFIEALGKGNHFGGVDAVFDIPRQYTFEAITPVTLFTVPAKIVKKIPVARWKLLERNQKLKQRVVKRKSSFKWSDAYRVNINEMDNHHKKLFEILEMVEHQVKDNSEDKKAALTVLNVLIDYTEYHFAAEEQLMEKYNFSYTTAHKEKHRELMRCVIQYKEDILSDTLETEKLVDILKDWILNHILEEDRKYSKYLNDQGVF